MYINFILLYFFLFYFCYNRLYFFTQEIVIFREDLVSRMRRNCIVPPDENTEPDVSKHVSK